MAGAPTVGIVYSVDELIPDISRALATCDVPEARRLLRLALSPIEAERALLALIATEPRLRTAPHTVS